jgi:hypothetical protein
VPIRTYGQKAKQLRELRGWLLAEEHQARDGDTSWFIETRTVLSEVIEETERNAELKDKAG